MEKPKKTHVLHVTGVMNRAGTETMLMNIYRNVDNEHVSFDFLSFASEHGDYDEEINRLGGRIIHVKKTNSFIELYRVIKANGPYDVIHAHTLFHCGLIVFIGKCLGINVRITHAHTTKDDNSTWKRRMYQKGMRLLIFLFSTHLFACSSNAGRYLFGHKYKTKKNYTYFPNLIDVEAFIKHPSNHVSAFKALECLGSGPVIGHIGRFMEAKNHPFILQVMRCFLEKEPYATLLLVGDGDNRYEMEQLAQTYGIAEHVRFVGIREDIATMLYCMDVFIFPSYYEGLGLVLLEAQACNVPCVTSDVIPEEADLDVGLLQKRSLSDSPEVWVRELQQSIKNEGVTDREIRDAFRKKGYTLKKGIEKLMAIYRDSTRTSKEHDNDISNDEKSA